MWTVLNNDELFVNILPGCCITKDPDDPGEYYIVQYISERVITAGRLTDDTIIEVVSRQEFLSGTWWLEE